MKFLIWLFVFCLAPGICIAQSKKIPVAVSHDGSDSVGQGVAFALKESLRGSQSFRFVNYEPAPTMPTIVVQMTSVDISLGSANNNASAIAVIILYDSSAVPAGGAYITSAVAAC